MISHFHCFDLPMLPSLIIPLNKDSNMFFPGQKLLFDNSPRANQGAYSQKKISFKLQ